MRNSTKILLTVFFVAIFATAILGGMEAADWVMEPIARQAQ